VSKLKLGIDYGTTTTLVSVTTSTRGKGSTILLDIGGDRVGYERSSLPSLIAISNQNHFSIGYGAVNLADSIPDKTIILRSLKRCLSCARETGGKIYDCQNPAVLPYCIGGKKLRIFDQEHQILSLIKRYLEEVLNQALVKQYFDSSTLGEIGFSVPALFGSEPRNTAYEALLEIVHRKTSDDRIAIDVLNEPTAAILACQDTIMTGKDGIYVICDVGGGTTDIAVFEKKENSLFLFKPKGLAIAGDDVDETVANSLFGEIDKIKDPRRREHILKEVRKAKERLTVMKETSVLGKRLNREDFNQIITPLLQKIVRAIEQGIKIVFNAYKPYSETGRSFKIRSILLSGGGSKIPVLKTLIEESDYLKRLNVNKVDYIYNDNLYRLYQDALPIVVVAYGTSMPREGIADTIQYMLPYRLSLTRGSEVKEIAPVYAELPVRFTITRANEGEIKLLAIDPGDKSKPVYDLMEELVSNEDKKILKDFFLKSPYWECIINKTNILWVTGVKGYRRSFNLPWQGGIEPSLFEKYRKQRRSGLRYN